MPFRARLRKLFHRTDRSRQTVVPHNRFTQTEVFDSQSRRRHTTHASTPTRPFTSGSTFDHDAAAPSPIVLRDGGSRTNGIAHGRQDAYSALESNRGRGSGEHTHTRQSTADSSLAPEYESRMLRPEPAVGSGSVRRLSAIGPGDHDDEEEGRVTPQQRRSFVEPTMPDGAFGVDDNAERQVRPVPLDESGRMSQQTFATAQSSKRSVSDGSSDYDGHSITESLHMVPLLAAERNGVDELILPSSPGRGAQDGGSYRGIDDFPLPDVHKRPYSDNYSPNYRGPSLRKPHSVDADSGTDVTSFRYNPPSPISSRHPPTPTDTRHPPPSQKIRSTASTEHIYKQLKRSSPRSSMDRTPSNADPAVVHTRVRPLEQEQRTEVLTREHHYYTIKPRIQPVTDRRYLPTKHYVQTLDGQLREISEEEAVEYGEPVWKGEEVIAGDDLRQEFFGGDGEAGGKTEGVDQVVEGMHELVLVPKERGRGEWERQGVNFKPVAENDRQFANPEELLQGPPLMQRAYRNRQRSDSVKSCASDHVILNSGPAMQLESLVGGGKHMESSTGGEYQIERSIGGNTQLARGVSVGAVGCKKCNRNAPRAARQLSKVANR